MKLGNYCTLCTDQKKLAKSIYKSLTLFKDGKNFYEQRKQ